MSVSTCVASLARQFRCTNPEILGENSGVARVELVRGPVPGLARFCRRRSGRFEIFFAL